ncbi:hypothetical protein D3C74_241250 [compost metagenome]
MEPSLLKATYPSPEYPPTEVATAAVPVKVPLSASIMLFGTVSVTATAFTYSIP